MTNPASPDAPRRAPPVPLATAPNSDDAPTIISTQKPAAPTGDLFAPPHAHTDLRGRRLAHYELIEPIGVGGMAAVLLATDLKLGRLVALKVLPPEQALNPEHLSRFESEARAAAKLDHENIARVYDCGEEQGLHYIAFEHVEGVDLKTLIERRGALPVGEAVQTILQAATGLAHAATRGVVHRDIKPSNIIVTPSGRAKIVDMGLARQLDGVGERVTQSGATLGTFDYISPEQAIEPRAADARSDIYSLGCTFYHMLTGQPPVPEGTAAKKLHHQQHVVPPDPRALNPAIPDAVAAVLGRMMAKDPASRYQRPEQLVYDLLALARALVPAADPVGSAGPGVMWFDAPIAAQPRLSKLTAAAAILGVTALVAILEMTRPATGPGFRIPTPGGRPVAAAIAGPEPPGDAAPAAELRSKPEAEPAPPQDAVHVAATARDVRDLFAKGDAVLRIRLTGAAYDFAGGDGDDKAALVFRGKRLEMESDDATRPATIHFAAGADDRAALAISGRDGQPVEAVLRGLRFQCDGGEDRQIAAVLGAEVGLLEIERCAFAMPASAGGARGAAAVVIDDRGQGEAPAVRMSECLFVGGAQAVQVTGRGSVVAVQCAFGPHHALVHLRGTGPETAVRFEHCSALLENSAVVLLEDGASARVFAGHCLFSRPPSEPGDDSPGDAILIRQIGGRAGDVAFRGMTGPERSTLRNAYHNLSAFWSDETGPANPRRAITLEDVRARAGFRDDDALELPQSPWHDPRPLARLAAGDERGAFAVNLKLARLRLPRAPLAGTLGVQRNVWGPSYAKLDPVGNAADAAGVRTRIVDPTVAAADPIQGVYPSLAHALLDARTQETILIKKNGLLPIDPVQLNRAESRLTVRPFPGYRPVLALGAATESDATLFRIHDGSVRFEALQFSLKPAGTDFRSLAIVGVTGAGQVAFQNCLLTLEVSGDVPLSAVVLPDADGTVRTGERRSAPQILFDSCFVRGKGDLLSVRGARRFELEVESTLAALDGSLVVSAGNARDSAATGATAQIRLRRTTAVFSEYVLALRLGRDEEKHPVGVPAAVQISCDGCLLAASAGRALVHVDGIDSDDQVRQLVIWATPADAKPTYYANTGPALLDVQPANPDRMPLPVPYDRERWLAFTQERVAEPFVRARFNAVAAIAGQPGDYRPRWLDPKPPANIDDCGAPLERLPAAAVEEPAPPVSGNS